ncbi:hypothetical protein HAX54_025001 [Datura stramonium]|uniref:beta-glucosidase n=1 Tax=Datura stramonium TaxID=4076 RepID=A0ABS8V1M8_DATST|nr:hypothetical protein [Datura stramonium]
MPAYYDSLPERVLQRLWCLTPSWNGRKMHANRDLVTWLPEEQAPSSGALSFQIEIDIITDPPHANYSYSVQAGIMAGMETCKIRHGSLRGAMSDLSLAKNFGSQEHRELAREAVRKSLVLLKNGKTPSQPLLPFKAPKILVAGTHADNLGYQCGGWTIEWQGVAGNDLTVVSLVNYTVLLVADTHSKLDRNHHFNCYQKTVDPSTEVVYQQNLSANFSLSLVVPVVLEPYIAQMDALLMWLPGEGQALLTLYLAIGFTGKLAALGSSQS